MKKLLLVLCMAFCVCFYTLYSESGTYLASSYSTFFKYDGKYYDDTTLENDVTDNFTSGNPTSSTFTYKKDSSTVLTFTRK